MNLFDGFVVLLLVIGVVAGARSGFLGPVLGLVGAVIGFLLALLAASVLRDVLETIQQPARAIVTIAGLGAFVLMGEAIGTAIGATISRGLHGSPFRSVDALGGAVVGVGHVVFLVWIVGGLLAMGVAPAFSAVARDSVAVQVVTDRLPAPMTVAGRLLVLLDTTELPPLLGGLEPIPGAPVELPDDATQRALAQSAVDSTALVTSGGCGFGLSVGSAFFIAPTYAVTNAHVVAGSTSTTVAIGGNSHEAVVVDFEPDADLALLHVPGASAPPLTLATAAPARGTTGVALGYPGGGDLTVTAAGVTNAAEIPGPNIYGEQVAEPRSVVELQAAIRRGNSGGPLVVAERTVGAVIFGASRVNPDVGYAIGVDEVSARLSPSIGATGAADTGACL